MSYNQYYNAVTNINTIWCLTRYQVDMLAKLLYSDTFINNITLLFGNPLDNINSLRVYPFDLRYIGVTEKSKLSIGNVKTTIEPHHLLTTQYEFIAYRGYIQPKYNNFLDYSPYTKIELYLPYIGYIELNPDEVMGYEMTVKYYIDILTGKCMVELTCDRNGVKHLVQTIDGQIGVDISIGGGGYAEVAQNLLMIGASALATVATSGATTPVLTSALISGVNASKVNIQKKGTLQPYLNFNAPQKIIMRIIRPAYIKPNNYGEVYGYPLNDRRVLNRLNGFTKISNIHLDDIKSATIQELTEIDRLLKNGVILSSIYNELKFEIDGKQYTFTRGMTWGMWTDSVYNTDGWLQGEGEKIYKLDSNGKYIVMGVNVFDTITPTAYRAQFVRNTIDFKIDGAQYTAYTGSTWGEWVSSDYNVNGWYVEDNQIRQDILNGYRYISSSATSVNITQLDIITPDDYIVTYVYDRFTFTIDGYPYNVPNGTTWLQWLSGTGEQDVRYKKWGNYVYRMESDVIRIVEGTGGIYVNVNDTISALDYVTSPYSTNVITFTIRDINNTLNTYNSIVGLTWYDWLTSPYGTDRYLIYNNYVCARRGLDLHRVLNDTTGMPQERTDVINATAYYEESAPYQ